MRITTKGYTIEGIPGIKRILVEPATDHARVVLDDAISERRVAYGLDELDKVIDALQHAAQLGRLLQTEIQARIREEAASDDAG